jgi:hypothetical protein
LFSNTTGEFNTAVGRSALFSNTTGSSNTANGLNALFGNTTGSDNTAVGSNAGRFIFIGASNLTGANSVFLGAGTRPLADGQTNQIVIGHNAIGNGSNSVTLGNTSITKTVLRGNVGIGTNTPNSKLEVTGNVAIGYTTAAPTNGLIVNGDVGIGTTSPGDKLEIGGAGAGIILASPDGTRYRVTVTDLGVLTVAAV